MKPIDVMGFYAKTVRLKALPDGTVEVHDTMPDRPEIAAYVKYYEHELWQKLMKQAEGRKNGNKLR